jgi:hypothetical protein
MKGFLKSSVRTKVATINDTPLSYVYGISFLHHYTFTASSFQTPITQIPSPSEHLPTSCPALYFSPKQPISRERVRSAPQVFWTLNAMKPTAATRSNI